jgi:hypothetical protein
MNSKKEREKRSKKLTPRFFPSRDNHRSSSFISSRDSTSTFTLFTSHSSAGIFGLLEEKVVQTYDDESRTMKKNENV